MMHPVANQSKWDSPDSSKDAYATTPPRSINIIQHSRRTTAKKKKRTHH